MANFTFDEMVSSEDFQGEIRSDFTARAANYDSGKSGSMHFDLINRLLAKYPPVSPVLDVACGTGYLSGCAYKTAETKYNVDIDVTGLDLTEAMLEVARTNYPGVKFVQGRSEDLPFRDETFQCAYICSAIVYFVDIPRALKEIYRVLKPGGFLSFQTTSSDSYIAGLAFSEACTEILGDSKSKEMFQVPCAVTDSPEAIRTLVESAGFTSMKCTAETDSYILALEDVTKTWQGPGTGVRRKNAFFSRFNKLVSDEDKILVEKKYLECMEKRRGEDGVLRDRVKHFFVQAWKKE